MTPTSQDRADFRAVMHGAGIFQLYEGLFIGLITAEEMADEMERREVVRTYPSRVRLDAGMSLAWSVAATLNGVYGPWWVWLATLLPAVQFAYYAWRDALAWRRARRPAVGP